MTSTNPGTRLMFPATSHGPPMPKTAHLQPELITFLEQLKKNNNREWFQKNEDRYDPARLPHPGGPAPPITSARRSHPAPLPARRFRPAPIPTRRSTPGHSAARRSRPAHHSTAGVMGWSKLAERQGMDLERCVAASGACRAFRPPAVPDCRE